MKIRLFFIIGFGILLVLIGVTVPGSASPGGDWWDSSWGKCMNITVTSAVSSTLTDFPVYINLTVDSDMNSDYTDLRFVDTYCDNGGNELAFEIENYTESHADIWLMIHSFTSGDNIISVYYDNAGASSGENMTGVWDDDYIVVHHLQETDIDDGAGDIVDSTSYENNGTTGGMDTDDQVAGKIAGSFDFNGSKGIKIPDTGDNVEVDYLTITAWIYPYPSTDNMNIVSRVNSAYRFRLSDGDAPWVYLLNESDTPKSTTSILRTTADTWQYIAVTYNGSDMFFQLDGDVDVRDSRLIGPLAKPFVALYLGAYVTGPPVLEAFNGTIDEIRISNTTRSADWINESYSIVQYQNEYVSLGSEEAAPPNNPPTLSDVWLTSTTGNNVTTDNITVNLGTVADIDGDTVYNITDWRKNNVSDAVLNMPMEITINSSSQDIKDYSSYGNDGTNDGAVCNKINGLIGGGCEFDGVDDYVDMSNQIIVENTANATISIWFKANIITEENYTLFTRGGELRTDYAIGISDGNLMYSCDGTPGVYCSEYIDVVKHLAVGSLTTDTWHHLVAILLGDDTIDFYFNGIFVGTINEQHGDNCETQTCYTRIGAGYFLEDNVDTGLRDFNGTIDEVRVWNRTLSANEIAAIYNNETILHSDATTTGDFWRANVTVNDGIEDGDNLMTDEMEILSVPVVAVGRRDILNTKPIIGGSPTIRWD